MILKSNNNKFSFVNVCKWDLDGLCDIYNEYSYEVFDNPKKRRS